MKILGFRILKEKDYKRLDHSDDRFRELEKIVEKTEIGKDIKKLEREYKKYIGQWFSHKEEGFVFRIVRVRYNSSWSCDKYCFEAEVPNHNEYIDIPFSDIEEEKIEKLTKKESLLWMRRGRV